MGETIVSGQVGYSKARGEKGDALESWSRWVRNGKREEGRVIQLGLIGRVAFYQAAPVVPCSGRASVGAKERKKGRGAVEWSGGRDHA